MSEPTYFDRYRVERCLGAGAMGIVYLATDPKLNRLVAIKVIKRRSRPTPSERERFLRECRSFATLDHPNIVRCYDVHDDRDDPFILMEYVPGSSLRELIGHGGPLPMERTIRLVSQIGSGLDHAADRNVIHRDIKPENVIVGSDDHVKVADFGLAKILGESGMSQSGMAVGTPAYMSPEQSMGRPLTGATDQFSLAVVTYEMLTGAHPFDGDFETPPSPRERNAHIPTPVSDAVMKGLSRSPRDRFDCCATFTGALRAGTTAPPPRPESRLQLRPNAVVQRSPWRRLAVAVAMTLVVVADGAVLLPTLGGEPRVVAGPKPLPGRLNPGGTPPEQTPDPRPSERESSDPPPPEPPREAVLEVTGSRPIQIEVSRDGRTKQRSPSSNTRHRVSLTPGTYQVTATVPRAVWKDTKTVQLDAEHPSSLHFAPDLVSVRAYTTRDGDWHVRVAELTEELPYTFEMARGRYDFVFYRPETQEEDVMRQVEVLEDYQYIVLQR